ncbi:MAG TPA: helix-turn-helix domain-containing protein [Acidimicrobiales bacterium]|nr:helix-turn-helix domain-containing protein [Acidimicrobiales bacterium]
MAELLSIVAFRSELASRLRARADESVDAITSNLYAEVGALHEAAGFADVEKLRARIRGTVDGFIGFIANGTPLSGAEREALHRMGAERARHGVSLEAVSDTVDITMEVLWRFVREVVQQPPVPPIAAAVVADIGSQAHTFAAAVRDAVLSGFALERRHGEIGRIYGVADIVDMLVDGRWVNRRDVLRTADALGVEVSDPLALLFVVPVSPDGYRCLDEAARQVAAAVPNACAGRLRGEAFRYVPVIASHVDPAAARARVAEIAAGLDVLVLVDQSTHDHRGLAAAARTLEAEVAPARALGRGPGAVVTTGETELFRLLRELPLEARMGYTRRVLGPVLDLPSGKARDAVATMQAYFRGRAAGRLDERAADLQLHRNSVRYRLDRTQALLGLNFRDAADRLRVEVALALYELMRQELAVYDDEAQPDEAGNA